MDATKLSHPFDKATKLTEQAGDFIGHTSEDYANMVGPFGGIIAANLLQSVLKHPNAQGEPISLTINYTAPISDGEFRIKVKEARTSRTTQHWMMELIQNEKIAATGTAVFAIRRNTWSATESKFPSVPPANQIEPATLEEGPVWVKNYDIRFIQGELPGMQTEKDNNPDSVTLQWIQDYPKRTLDFLSLASICDAFFPRVFVRRQKIAPSSTVSLTTYFHVGLETLKKHGEREVLGHARAMRFNEGFFDQIAEIWTPEGELLATSNQIVYYKD